MKVAHHQLKNIENQSLRQKIEDDDEIFVSNKKIY